MIDIDTLTLVIAIIGLPIAAIKFFLVILAFLDERYSRKGKK